MMARLGNFALRLFFFGERLTILQISFDPKEVLFKKSFFWENLVVRISSPKFGEALSEIQERR